ncbi:MAG: S8 family peptidase [Bowdeniella nasicola]|nr:S8 family peptidase [Bowdeniella nasicola]
MRKSFAAFSALATAAALVLMPGAASADGEENQVDTSGLESSDNNRFIIGYKSSITLQKQGAGVDSVNSVLSKHGVSVEAQREMSTGGKVIELNKGLDKKAAAALLADIAKDPAVEYVEPDVKMFPTWTPSDRYYDYQWHYHRSNVGIDAPTAWNTTRGRGVTVAILDTGITSHPDLNKNVVSGYDMISDSWAAGDGNGRDSNPRDEGDWINANTCGNRYFQSSSWHGTHVAGTVAASANDGGVVGVAPEAKILPVRVLGKCGGYTSDIADGIVWASGGSVWGTSRNYHPASVINMSLGGRSNSCPYTYQRAINTATSNGATVVVAAGNDGRNAWSTTPANCSNVLTIGATDRYGAQSYYSNYGSVVDVSAPGGDTSYRGHGVLSTVNSGRTYPSTSSYAYYQGTSMATPHVAGVAALVKAANPRLSATDVANVIRNSTKRMPGRCWGGSCGTGLVDAGKAVQKAKNTNVRYWW